MSALRILTAVIVVGFGAAARLETTCGDVKEAYQSVPCCGESGATSATITLTSSAPLDISFCSAHCDVDGSIEQCESDCRADPSTTKLDLVSAHLHTLLTRIAKQQSLVAKEFEDAWLSYNATDRAALLTVTSAIDEDKLPLRASLAQTKSDAAALYAQGKDVAPAMLKAMATATFNAGGVFSLPPPGGRQESLESFNKLTNNKLQETIKELEEMERKITSKYAGNATQLIDIVRASAIFTKPNQITEFLKGMLDSGSDLKIVRFNDRMSKPAAGYRDVNLGVKLSEGEHIGELQVHLQKIIDVKEISHVSYAIARGIDTSLPEFDHPLASVSTWALPEEKAELRPVVSIKKANHTIGSDGDGLPDHTYNRTQS